MALPALVLSRFETKLSVALIFVIARSALHFKKLRDCFELIDCFQIILNRVVAKTLKKSKTPREGV